MTRSQMFGIHYDGLQTMGDGHVTLTFGARPRSVPESDCGPDGKCTLEERQMNRWTYRLCLSHSAWFFNDVTVS